MQSESLNATEQECSANATAPRVSLQSMQDKIEHSFFTTGKHAVEARGENEPTFVIPESLNILTICVLVMKNGFVLIGKSAPASPENFNADLGQKLAYEDAIRQLWPLEGYALREQIASIAGCSNAGVQVAA